MKTIAILNEKGGTAKTTTSVNLAAALGEMGKKVLLVDLDGQAASSRWLGVEGDTRLADALLQGSGLTPIENVLPGVSLAPASGKLDSISHNLRPTQGSQLRRVLAEVKDRYDYILIDCPPSLGNRLIGNALLAASHAIVPVETSILALDGLRILLTMLDDIRQGFEHDIELIGALGCRFNSRTRLSRLVLAELHRALPGKVFGTAVHETVRMQECPASGKSVLEYAPDCSAAADYRAVAGELVYGITPCTLDLGFADLTETDEIDHTDCQGVSEFRKLAGEIFQRSHHTIDTVDEPVSAETDPVTEEPQDVYSEPEPESETPSKPPAAVRSVNITLSPKSPEQDETATDVKDVAPEPEPAVGKEPVKTPDFDDDQRDQPEITVAKRHIPRRDRDNVMVAVAATVLLGILGIGGWVGFKTFLPAPDSASAKQTPVTVTVDKNTPLPKTDVAVEKPSQTEPEQANTPEVDVNNEKDSFWTDRQTAIMSEYASEQQPEVAQSSAGRTIVTPQTKQPLDSKVAQTKETPPPSVEKPLTDAVAKSEPVSKTPTTPPSSDAPTTQPAPRQARADDYPAGLTLTAVMYGKTSRKAIISGTVAYEGDTIKGAKVVKILPDSVEVEANGFRFLLGTGPKPVWLKATQVPPPQDKKPDIPATDSDSQE